VKEDAGISFLQWCLGTDSGYAAIGAKHFRTQDWKETFFPYPSDLDGLAEYVNRASRTYDVYFCPTILRAPERKKHNIILSNVIWADLDLCPPDKMLVPPTVLVQTSRNKHHAYWKLTDPESAIDVEEINRRIAYYHAPDGCDKGGWDLTQYLRIPGTNNYKYLASNIGSTIVTIIDPHYELKYSLEDFDVYPRTQPKVVSPKPEVEGRTAEEILNSIVGQTKLHESARELFYEEPEGSWSEKLWRLELILLGAGFTDEEVFVVCKEAACNKYARDNRPEDHLWEDICRAKAEKELQDLTPSSQDNTIGSDKVYIPRKPLLTEDEHTLVRQRHTIVEEYVDWAKEATDAPKQYHEAGAFITLSGALSGAIRIPTSAGVIKPNLWFMTLGETTLSRKTTCMNLAISILEDIDKDCVLATDGSVEGIMSAIASRPSRSSIYHKDEFSGLLDAMAKKDYLSGAMEHFTQLYDSQHLKRTLRAGTVDIRNPIFILYAGGIRDRIYTCLSLDHIASGFIPRFVFISPKVNMTNLKPIGPPVMENLTRRAEIVTRLRGIYEYYQPDQDQHISNNGSVTFQKSWDAEFAPDAWETYNRIEYTMHKMAFESDVTDLMMPMMDRLAKSGMKMATLIAAAERLDAKITVFKTDILHAFHYIESYLDYTIEVVSNAGKSASEMLIEKVVSYVTINPGVARSLLMRKFHMTSKSADVLFDTIEQRGLVTKAKRHSGFAYYPSHPMASPEGEKVDFG
jgi:hypothetical protein